MPSLTSIFLPEKRRHLLLSSEQQQLEATDLLQIDLLDSTAVLRCFLSFPFPVSLPLSDSLPLMVARVYQSGSATVANLNPILRTHFLCAGCSNWGAETRRPSLNLVDPAPKSRHLNWSLSRLNRGAEPARANKDRAYRRHLVTLRAERTTVSQGHFLTEHWAQLACHHH